MIDPTQGATLRIQRLAPTGQTNFLILNIDVIKALARDGCIPDREMESLRGRAQKLLGLPNLKLASQQRQLKNLMKKLELRYEGGGAATRVEAHVDKKCCRPLVVVAGVVVSAVAAGAILWQRNYGV